MQIAVRTPARPGFRTAAFGKRGGGEGGAEGEEGRSEGEEKGTRWSIF